MNLEFIIVSVNNAYYKLFVGLLYHPPVHVKVLDDLFSVLETLNVQILYCLAILMLIFF